MLSLRFVLYSLKELLSYPSSLPYITRGSVLGEVLRRERLVKWNKIRSTSNLVVTSIFGMRLPINPEDLSDISSSIATLGWFNLSVTELLRLFVRRGMTFVDVGANIGYYTLLASKQVGEEGLVLAFEPEPLNFYYLTRATSINGIKNVKLFNEALSDHEGTVRLYLSSNKRPEAHSIVRMSEKWIEVPCTTLDRVAKTLERKIDFVKIHVSGAEMNVLSGAEGLIQSDKPPIILTVLGYAIYNGKEGMIKVLRQYYIPYEVLNSPLIIRSTSFEKLMKKKYVEVLMIPRNRTK